MTVHFYAAMTLDGFLATPEHSLDWLFAQPFDAAGPMNYDGFFAGIGALVMGSSTYEWLRRAEAKWPYEEPTFVLTRRAFRPGRDGHPIRARERRELIGEFLDAAAGKDLWVAGAVTSRASSPTPDSSMRYGCRSRL